MKRLIKRSTKPHHVKEIELALLANALLDQYFTEGYAFRYHQVAVNYAGSSFGDMALTEDKPRTATLLALTDLQLVSMNKEGYQVQKFMHSDRKYFNAKFSSPNSKSISSVDCTLLSLDTSSASTPCSSRNSRCPPTPISGRKGTLPSTSQF